MAFGVEVNDADAAAAYQRYYVPGPGRVLFQAGFANFNPHAVTKVDLRKDDRAPLLVMGNEKDHTVPASVSREAAKLLANSKAVVDYKEFAGRPYFTPRRGRLGGGGRLCARLGQQPCGAGIEDPAAEGLAAARRPCAFTRRRERTGQHIAVTHCAESSVSQENRL